MNKPITVAYEELKQEMANLINTSGLQAFMIEAILKDYLNEVKMVAERQYQIEKIQYEQSLVQVEEEKEEEH